MKGEMLPPNPRRGPPIMSDRQLTHAAPYNETIQQRPHPEDAMGGSYAAGRGGGMGFGGGGYGGGYGGSGGGGALGMMDPSSRDELVRDMMKAASRPTIP